MNSDEQLEVIWSQSLYRQGKVGGLSGYGQRATVTDTESFETAAANSKPLRLRIARPSAVRLGPPRGGDVA